MAKLFVLSYTFLGKEATVLVQKKTRRSVVKYSITILREPLNEFYIDGIILDPTAPELTDEGEGQSLVHAIRKALYQQIEAGLM